MRKFLIGGVALGSLLLIVSSFDVFTSDTYAQGSRSIPSSYGRVVGFSGENILLEDEVGTLRVIRMAAGNNAVLIWTMPKTP